MGITKSKLLQAQRAVRDEIFATVKVQLADENLTYREIAEVNGLSVATVQRVAERSGISRPVGPRPRLAVSEVEDDGE
jgi:transposase-like protein